MIDWGVITTGIGTIVGGIITGLATWKSMSKETESSIDDEQREWRQELINEVKDLRDRVKELQSTIDTLMEERQDLKEQVTDLRIQLRNQQASITDIKENH